MADDGPSGSGAARDKLKALSDEFLGVLPDRMSAIEQTCHPLIAPIWDAPDIDAHYRTIHNLAGSSGTFGFNELSAAARAVLDVLEPLLGGDCEVTPQIREAFEAAMNDFRSAADNPVQDEKWLDPPG